MLPIVNTISNIEAGIRNSDMANKIRIHFCHEMTKFQNNYKSSEKNIHI